MQAPWQLSKHRSGGREQPQKLGDLGEEGEGQACSTELRVRALEMPSQAVPSPAPPTRCVAGPGGPWGHSRRGGAAPALMGHTVPSQVPGKGSAWHLMNSSWTN